MVKPRSFRRHLFRRFSRDRSGATAVELALLSFPFFFMLMMIVETAMIFWTRQVLQEALGQASRTILTGESRTLYPGPPAAQATAFRAAICARMRMSSDCTTRLIVDVQPQSTFTGAPGSMVSGGAIDETQYAMRPVQPSEIVIIRAAYKAPVFVAGYFGSLSRLTTGENVLESVLAFRAEPFPTS